MNPSTRTRHLNQWIQTHSGQDMTYPALHGVLCARLVGPDAPDWQAPLAGLLPHDAELDEKSAEALHHLIAELEAQADEAQLALPSQCRLFAGHNLGLFEGVLCGLELACRTFDQGGCATAVVEGGIDLQLRKGFLASVG